MEHSAVRGVYRLLSRTRHSPAAPVILTAVSTAAAVQIRQALPHVPLIVVPNGIDPGQWRTKAPAERDADRVHAVAVGRLARRKEPIQLLEALRAAHSRLAERGVALTATFAGTGPCMQPMERYLHRRGMDGWVRLAGHLNPGGVKELLASADLFVNPSCRESFGIAALEARTSGVPVLARLHTGVADFVRHRREGVLCGHSTFALSDELVWLARTPGALITLARHSREAVPTHCTWPVVTDAFTQAYSTVTR